MQIPNIPDADLLKMCSDLQILMGDLNSLELFTELKNVCHTVPCYVNSPLETLKLLFSYISKEVILSTIIAFKKLLSCPLSLTALIYLS